MAKKEDTNVEDSKGSSKKYVLVNPEKVNRARNIIAICKRGARSRVEEQIEEKWAPIIAKIKGDLEVEVYKLLGGLVRTVEQQKKAEKRGEAIKKNKAKVDKKHGKKKKVEEEEEDSDLLEDDEVGDEDQGEEEDDQIDQ